VFSRTFYNRVPAWVNAKRCKDLTSFRTRTKEYYQKRKMTWQRNLVENHRARELRESLNRDLVHVEWLVALTGVSDKVSVREAPMLGGSIYQGVPLLANMFEIHTLDLEPQSVLDVLDRAIGTLESDRRAALLRTLNPFFWIGLVLSAAARLPFHILGELGFDRTKAEHSVAGRLVQAFIWLIGITGSLATLIEFSGLGKTVRAGLRSRGLLP